MNLRKDKAMSRVSKDKTLCSGYGSEKHNRIRDPPPVIGRLDHGCHHPRWQSGLTRKPLSMTLPHVLHLIFFSWLDSFGEARRGREAIRGGRCTIVSQSHDSTILPFGPVQSEHHGPRGFGWTTNGELHVIFDSVATIS